ncbi:MAG: UDP-2,3-diacylglucosamine diphosphatase LpxI [Rickettsia endosymbiont of Bryobia graminum]|nr:UDP-2,3-diacylglucosamine diphosphatase LpxI [Rickettsia endosymbiont of Bryobia graminum]
MINQSSNNVLGVIAGNGALPVSIANNCMKQGIKCYIAIISEEVDLTLYENFSYNVFKIAKVGSVIKYFKQHNVKNIVFAGGIKRVNLKSIKVDLIGSILLARILKQKFLGDDKILTIIAGFLEEKGFKVISSEEVFTINNDVTTKILPLKRDLSDIELGVKLLKNIGTIDVGQSVIVEDGYILGIEAAEGTDNLIKRCADLRKKAAGAVLVKMMKDGQDSRLDMPTIGPETINNLNKYKYKGLAIQKDKVIIIDSELTIELANKYGIFIYQINI